MRAHTSARGPHLCVSRWLALQTAKGEDVESMASQTEALMAAIDRAEAQHTETSGAHRDQASALVSALSDNVLFPKNQPLAVSPAAVAMVR
jgi:hypothetical protein